MNGSLCWKKIAVTTAWAAAGVVALMMGNPFALMVALVTTAMVFFIEDARAAR